MDYFVLFKNIGYIVVVLTFIKAVYEYMMAMKWKKSEFLSKEIKEFFSDSNVKTVCTLLDYNVRKIQINDKDFIVTDNILIDSLLTHDKKQQFSAEEAVIRDMFDSFFDKLSNFNVLIQNGLVEKSQVKNYLSYYLDIICNPGRKPNELIDVFNDYISYYKFNNVKDLIELYKKSPKGTSFYIGKLKVVSIFRRI